ncbi:hypothetical protein [Rheinheimera sp. F8]|uniref:hypothetical protein n=1 Tax=Rheinheimera sp. F8 TaxID=1763998 RepID=UPI000744BCAE|nr:hypothetical protein [Rheinheimera sp. F8]ALZ77297.1 hypothetical protein ATY27_17050 [Rheinheimera sp. F8]
MTTGNSESKKCTHLNKAPQAIRNFLRTIVNLVTWLKHFADIHQALNFLHCSTIRQKRPYPPAMLDFVHFDTDRSQQALNMPTEQFQFCIVDNPVGEARYEVCPCRRDG